MTLSFEFLEKKVDFQSKMFIGSIAVIPIINQEVSHDYISLDAALKSDFAEITEVDQSGSVPDLSFVNKSEKMIFIWDGEELAGGKQNRVANTSILVNPKSSIFIPVSCIEQGRWHFKDSKFETSKYSIPNEVRRMKNFSVTENLKRNKKFSSNQYIVWDKIEKYSKENNLKSDTMSISDMIYANIKAIEKDITKIKYIDDQNGVVIAINNEVIGLEYISSKKVFKDLYKKILLTYAIDVTKGGKLVIDDVKLKMSVEEFLDNLKSTINSEFKAVSAGVEKRLENDKVEAVSLEYENELVYFSACRK